MRIYRDTPPDGGQGGGPASLSVPPPAPVDDGRLAAAEQALAEARMREARLQARLESPNVPGDVLGMFKGSPEDLVAFAKAMNEKMATSPVQPPLAQPPASIPVPPPGIANPTEDLAALEHRRTIRELKSPRLFKGIEPGRVAEAFDVAFRDGFNQHAKDRAAGRGSLQPVDQRGGGL